MSVIQPGSVLGVFGGGQLGRMFAQAAAQLGYHVHVFAPESNPPAAQVAVRHWQHEYEDSAAVQAFAQTVQAVTCEFENIPPAALETAARFVPTRPDAQILAIAQDRRLEREFLDQHNLPTTKHASVKSQADLPAALENVGGHGVLKSQRFGYDGKGQARVEDPAEISTAWQQIGAVPAIYEAWVDLSAEISLVVARSTRGEIAFFGPLENVHVNHILDITTCPADIPEAIKNRAIEIGQHVAEALDLVGLICVEMFVTSHGEILINELAPRPHNSGHLTIEAHVTSQFEQQVRTLCGLPLGNTRLRQPAAMVNLLGDLWTDGEPDFSAMLPQSDVHLHLYGKQEPRPGRKMGHITALADDVHTARQAALTARDIL
jgi:5-(carboxyamino)imidazole ribonucleotide synthase